MFVGLIESVIPAGPEFSIVPGLVALVASPLILVFGPRLPVWALAALGPIGAALIAFALATTHGYADAAVLYLWPVIWMSYFFGTRGTAFIVAWIAVVHGIALLEMPAGQGNLDRWMDVTSAVLVVAVVIRILAGQNERLVARNGGEEFVVVLPDADAETARALAERARESVEMAASRTSAAKEFPPAFA